MRQLYEEVQIRYTKKKNVIKCQNMKAHFPYADNKI